MTLKTAFRRPDFTISQIFSLPGLPGGRFSFSPQWKCTRNGKPEHASAFSRQKALSHSAPRPQRAITRRRTRSPCPNYRFRIRRSAFPAEESTRKPRKSLCLYPQTPRIPSRDCLKGVYVFCKQKTKQGLCPLTPLF